MNLLLFTADEVDRDGRAAIRDRRRLDALRHLPLQPGTRLRAGVIDGACGAATVLRVERESIELQLQLDEEPPPAAALDLVLALPRPKMLRRILRCVSECGVKRLWLINSFRVDKSYWSSPLLEPARLRPYLLEGLEQAGDTRLPQVELLRRFRPFVEDRLGALSDGRCRLVAHPAATADCPYKLERPATLAIGPEGGFIEFELDLLRRAGFAAVSLGPRVLRVETAVPVLLGRLTV